MTISNGVADAIEEAVTAAYEAEDYLLADGNRDKAKVRSHMLEVLKHRKVLSRGERKDKAISRGRHGGGGVPVAGRPGQLVRRGRPGPG